MNVHFSLDLSGSVERKVGILVKEMTEFISYITSQINSKKMFVTQ